MRKTLSIVGRLLAVASLLGVAAATFVVSTPRPAFAAQGKRSVPEGQIQYSKGQSTNGVLVPLYAGYNYPWQISGPFTASALTWTSFVIVPSSYCTNLADGALGYPGPYRVLIQGTANYQVSLTSATFTANADGTSGTAWARGAIYSTASTASNPQGAYCDTISAFGSLTPLQNVAVTLSSTATAGPNNINFWVMDQDQ